jgi:hypothetical protein
MPQMIPQRTAHGNTQPLAPRTRPFGAPYRPLDASAYRAGPIASYHWDRARPGKWARAGQHAFGKEDFYDG